MHTPEAPFKNIPGDGEWIGRYRIGGFHPIHLGVVLNGRYEILRKLGFGSFSTVWLSWDTESSQYCALKVLIANKDENGSEEGCLRCLAPTGTEAVIDHPVPILRDAFILAGPNGRHRVLVLDVLGTNLIEYFYDMRNRLDQKGEKFGTAALKIVSRRMAVTLEYIHAKGIVHRDVQFGNFIFPLLKDISPAEGKNFHLKAQIFAVERTDGEPIDEHVPRYIVEPLPLKPESPDISTASLAQLKLSDFGAACKVEESDKGFPAYPVSARAPEVILDHNSDKATDIWALGCVLFRLVTFCELIHVDGWSRGEEQDDENLQSMNETLGPLSDSILSRWPGRDKFLNEDGSIKQEQLEDPFAWTLDELWRDHAPPSMSAKDSADFLDAVRKICNYDPVKRPTAHELLDHPWFKI